MMVRDKCETAYDVNFSITATIRDRLFKTLSNTVTF